jgi:hypothetical protein
MSRGRRSPRGLVRDDSRDAVDLARIDEPVVVLVDGPMLVNAGLALATALEQTPSLARVYILTDTPEDPRWRELRGDVVAKPSDRDQLLKLVA